MLTIDEFIHNFISPFSKKLHREMKHVIHIKYQGSLTSAFSRFLIIMSVLLFSGQLMMANGLSRIYDDSQVLKINPNYKIKRLSTGIVIATTNLGNGQTVTHEFHDISAEVLLAAIRRQPVRLIIPVIARKYYIDLDESRREVKHAINVLTEWDILVDNTSLKGD